jgi:hypothetical protein
LTFDLTLKQTGSVVITSEQQLFTYMSNLSSTELYAVNYPVSATIADGTKVTISSDAELQTTVNAAVKTQEALTLAAENVKKLEPILVNGKFKIESFVHAGVNSAIDYRIKSLKVWLLKWCM